MHVRSVLRNNERCNFEEQERAETGIKQEGWHVHCEQCFKGGGRLDLEQCVAARRVGGDHSSRPSLFLKTASASCMKAKQGEAHCCSWVEEYCSRKAAALAVCRPFLAQPTPL